jgi:hypothetical protein
MKITLNRYQKATLIYGFLTVVLLGIIFKFGLFAAVKISEFLQGRKPLPEETLYNNLLSAPQFYPLPEATNSASLKVSGFSQPNERIDVYLNDLNVKSFEVDSEGKFEGSLALSLGLNKIYAVAKDKQDQQSPSSQVWSVFFEDTAPMLEILEPADGATIKKTSRVTLKGKTAPTSKITVNSHQVVVDSEGNFAYSVSLQSGENKFTIVCLDPSQNKTEKEWLIIFQP